MSRNAAVDPVNDLQSTPLHYACREGNLDIVTGLINFSANLEARNKDNLSPLHVAAGMGHIEVTKRLLDNGAKMEAEDNALYTPLWRAAYYGHPEVVEVLLDKGANRLARNKKGRKPGDVFSPSVDKEKQERIKTMLGMDDEEAGGAPAVTQSSASAVVVTAASAQVTNKGAIKSAPELTPPTPAGVPVSTTSVPTPAFKAPRSGVPEPTPNQPDSNYIYPDPSPANSPSSVLQSNATALSEAMVTSAMRQVNRMASEDSIDSAAASMIDRHHNLAVNERGPLTATVLNGQGGMHQKTPGTSKATAAEMENLRKTLHTKEDELELIQQRYDEMQENLEKEKKGLAQEMSHVSSAVTDLTQQLEERGGFLERKEKEVADIRKQMEITERHLEERIKKLEGDLVDERSKGGGCGCTIS
ncbi:unnamed protein product [Choristocarpus tenellus]